MIKLVRRDRAACQGRIQVNLTAVAASCFLVLFSVSGSGTTGLYLLPRLIFDLSSRGGGRRVSLRALAVFLCFFFLFFFSVFLFFVLSLFIPDPFVPFSLSSLTAPSRPWGSPFALFSLFSLLVSVLFSLLPFSLYSLLVSVLFLFSSLLLPSFPVSTC